MIVTFTHIENSRQVRDDREAPAALEAAIVAHQAKHPMHGSIPGIVDFPDHWSVFDGFNHRSFTVDKDSSIVEAPATGTTAAGSRYTIDTRVSHAITGCNPRGYSQWFARNIHPGNVLDTLAQAEAAGWTDLTAFVESF